MGSENTMLEALIPSFPNSNKENWKRAASKEIDAEDPYEELRWQGHDGLQFLPFYDQSDTLHPLYSEKFSISPARNSFSGPRKWLCMPSVAINDEIKANKISLDHLANGADGILFNINGINRLDLSMLLQHIQWPYCSLSWYGADLNFFENTLPIFIRESKFDPNTLMGTLFWDTFPKKVDHLYYFQTTQNYKPFGLIVRPDSPANEIAEALSSAVWFFEAMANEQAAEKTFSSIAFSLSADNNFFETVAKLKVLRMLWFQVSRAYQLKNFKPADLHIHVRSDPWTSKNFQPHANMLKGTAVAIASIAGGCDSLTIFPEDEHNSVMNRIARNVSNILREESHLNKVADPLVGSYALDRMEIEIAEHAWKVFQSKMKK